MFARGIDVQYCNFGSFFILILTCLPQWFHFLYFSVGKKAIESKKNERVGYICCSHGFCLGAVVTKRKESCCKVNIIELCDIY